MLTSEFKMEERKNLSFCQKMKDQNLYSREKIPLFIENVMKQKISKNSDIFMDTEIEEKKSIIHDLFLSKFGKNFFKTNNIIDEFQFMYGQYLLNISGINKNKNNNSDKKNNTNNNNKSSDNGIKIKKKKMNEKELNTRINMGNMIYLDLRDNTVSNKSLMNDKLFHISKNLIISNKKRDVMSKYISESKKKSMIFNKKLEIQDNNNTKIQEVRDHNSFENINNNIHIKSFKNSLSQNNLKIPRNVLNVKNYLLNNKNQQKNDSKTSTSNNYRYIESEKQNDHQVLSNPLYIYMSNTNNRYETKKENSSKYIMSNSQTNFFSPQISNYYFHKFNKTIQNSNDSEISTNLMNNQIKSLSTSEMNENKNIIKNQYKRYNSLINISSQNFLSKFKNNFNNKAKLLKKSIKKSNKRLIKLIDYNFSKKMKTDAIQELKRKDNFMLVKSLIDKKISNKVLAKFNKQEKKIKPILKMSQNDEKKLSYNKYFEEKYFLKNYKKMDDNLALYFIGDLFKTKKIKFHLKEFQEQRKEIMKQKEKEKLIRIKNRLLDNDLTIKRIKFILRNKNNTNKET